jgi:hypothetical protein
VWLLLLLLTLLLQRPALLFPQTLVQPLVNLLL